MRRILLVVTALVACTALFAGVAVAKNFVCKAVPCVGTANPDVITERKGSVVDVIRAGDGDDGVDAGAAGKDRDDVLGQGGNDVLFVQDGDFRDNANCGPGPDDVASIDASFNPETNEISIDGTRGCEQLLIGGEPASASAVAASEAKGE
jgi:hypothetical protein